MESQTLTISAAAFQLSQEQQQQQALTDWAFASLRCAYGHDSESAGAKKPTANKPSS